MAAGLGYEIGTFEYASYSTGSLDMPASLVFVSILTSIIRRACHGTQWDVLVGVLCVCIDCTERSGRVGDCAVQSVSLLAEFNVCRVISDFRWQAELRFLTSENLPGHSVQLSC
jgi:hypothetical protein